MDIGGFQPRSSLYLRESNKPYGENKASSASEGIIV